MVVLVKKSINIAFACKAILELGNKVWYFCGG